MLRELYLHPNGQLPAYEWNFSDVNPPVHAWATLLVYETELEQRGAGDVAWLKSAFQKLLVNFTWWINRKDPTGSQRVRGRLPRPRQHRRVRPQRPAADRRPPRAVRRHGVDGVLRPVHARHRPRAVPRTTRSTRTWCSSSPSTSLFIAAAMDRIGDNQDELWDEEDGFFYDVLRLPDGSAQRLKVRSMVGLLPLCATTILPLEGGDSISDELLARLRRRIEAMPELLATIHDARVPRRQRPAHAGRARRDQAAPGPRPDARRGRVPQPARPARAVALPRRPPVPRRRPRPDATRCATCRPSPTPACSAATRTGAARCGSRSTTSSCAACCTSTPTTATTSRWSARPARARQCTLFEVADGARPAARRRSSSPTSDGRRPVYGGTERFQTDPHWKDLLLFYEYFHGDNGAGLGASHQTGWTGLVARIIQVLGYLRPEDLLSDAITRATSSTEAEQSMSRWPARPGHLRAQHRRLAPRRRRAAPARRPRSPTSPTRSGTASRRRASTPSG